MPQVYGLAELTCVYRHVKTYFIIMTFLLFAYMPLHGQTYLNATGAPTFSTLVPVENGAINISNGNLHLEIQIGSFPQRGKVRLVEKMVYDARIWKIVNNGGSSSWQATNIGNDEAGWRFVTSVDPGTVSFSLTSTSCNGSQVLQTWQNFTWTGPDGTQRLFPITTTQNQCTGLNTSAGDAYAQDASGFHMYITNFNTATVFTKDGTKIYPTTKDTNGNLFTVDANGNVIDTLNRTPVTKTVNGNNTSYNVLNSKGTTSAFTVTTGTINVNTAFGIPGVAEYAGTLTAVTGISLPDGTSYSFTYDTGTTSGFYGLIAQVTWPFGGTVQYGFTNFADAYGNVNRWVTSRTASGNWSYTPSVISSCAPGTTGVSSKSCCQSPAEIRKPIRSLWIMEHGTL